MSEYGRFFTSTRHIPMTFGTNPATGERLPGGPYTSAQAFGGIGAGVLMWLSRPLWGTGMALFDLILGLIVVATAGWLLRYAPDDLTEIWAMLIGASKLMDAPTGGRYEGRAFKLRKPPKMPACQTPADPAGSASAAQAQQPSTDPTPQIRRQLGTSSVDRLLAHTTQTEENAR